MKYIHRLFFKILNKNRVKNQNCVIVVGAPRSGTSLLCDILDGLGVDFGDRNKLIKANIRNPRGFFQRRDLYSVLRRIYYKGGKKKDLFYDPNDSMIANNLSEKIRRGYHWYLLGRILRDISISKQV